MSNFKIKSRSGNQWHDMNNLLQYRTMIAIEDLAIPVLPLLQLSELYQLMGREKDVM